MFFNPNYLQIILEQYLILRQYKTIYMKNFIFIFLTFGLFLNTQAQENAYQAGESFKFRIHYGFFNAGYATLNLKKDTFQGKKYYHAIGKGWTVGLSKLFMKVDDNYESYFGENNLPKKFIRKIDEGGYTKNVELRFDQKQKKVTVIDKKKKSVNNYNTTKNIHDLISVFYYLRNYDTSKLKQGDEISVNLFFDNEVYPFKLKYLGKDVTKTKMGRIHSLKFRPIVMSGRVFKENESVTVWVSNDKNKMPLLIKAKLMVGSLKASLTSFKGIKHPINYKS